MWLRSFCLTATDTTAFVKNDLRNNPLTFFCFPLGHPRDPFVYLSFPFISQPIPTIRTEHKSLDTPHPQSKQKYRAISAIITVQASTVSSSRVAWIVISRLKFRGGTAGRRCHGGVCEQPGECATSVCARARRRRSRRRRLSSWAPTTREWRHSRRPTRSSRAPIAGLCWRNTWHSLSSINWRHIRPTAARLWWTWSSPV